MKLNKFKIFIAGFFIGLMVLSSCYTKKNGIVPCPHGKIDMKSSDLGDIKTEPV